ncbi:MAG: choline dehydrogenase [Alphaproteobacteria bacterium]|nr:choline dehydrogenase [Alphaproteobacteria bacterium]
MAEGYDYIVVGGGSAGCVLANRLSAKSGASVLLVEAGKSDWNPLIRVPIMASFFMRHKYHNWGYSTEPEPHLANREISWPRGKVLGGSSAINGMVYIRGNRGDYDHWAQLGLRDWSYEKVLPYFQKSENFLDKTLDGARNWHGEGGELPVTLTPTQDQRYDAFVEAGQQAGFPANRDFNGEKQEGFGRYHFTIRDGERWSTARSFLDPARGRPNLTILTGAHLLRVIVENGRAKGVEVKTASGVQQISAAQEVVLSCGAITSPTALMLSGIGAADELRKHGVNVKVDLPAVGKNLQDHLTVRVVHSTEAPDRLFTLRRIDRAALSVLRAMLTRTGESTAFPLEGGAFIRSRQEMEYPDLQVHFFRGIPATNGLRIPFMGPPPGVYDGYGFAGTICQLRPESRGDISLRNADPFAKPVIRANYLSTETDRLTMRAGVKILRDVLRQPAFAPLRSREVMPGPGFDSDADIDRYVALNAGTVYHPVGTCRMGVDPASVLDEQLRVRGVEGLRVADASVMPTLISGNTNAPSIMIAEKCADMMLQKAA